MAIIQKVRKSEFEAEVYSILNCVICRVLIFYFGVKLTAIENENNSFLEARQPGGYQRCVAVLFCLVKETEMTCTFYLL